MINTKKLNWINTKKVNIFTIDEFFNKEYFELIEKNFPDFESINKENFFKFENNKFAITSGSKEYKDFILSNSILKNFDDLINSYNFKKYFFYNLYKKILLSRGLDFKHFIKMIKIPKFVDNIGTNFFSKNFSIFSKYRITIQYSYIMNKGKIVPHADAGDKLLTLLLFFPKYKNESEHFKKEKNYGPTFWDSNFKNLSNGHINNPLHQKEFINKSKILYKADFLKNFCVGFIKNEHSWHSVEPIDINNDYIRKSININIYY